MAGEEDPRVHEDKVELDEGEDHVRAGREAIDERVAMFLRFELEELTKLEARVDHTAHAKGHRPDAQIERAAMCLRVARVVAVGGRLAIAVVRYRRRRLLEVVARVVAVEYGRRKGANPRKGFALPVEQEDVDEDQKQNRAHVEVDVEAFVPADGNAVRYHLGHREAQPDEDEDLAVDGTQQGDDAIDRVEVRVGLVLDEHDAPLIGCVTAATGDHARRHPTIIVIVGLLLLVLMLVVVMDMEHLVEVCGRVQHRLGVDSIQTERLVLHQTLQIEQIHLVLVVVVVIVVGVVHDGQLVHARNVQLRLDHSRIVGAHCCRRRRCIRHVHYVVIVCKNRDSY